VIIFPGPDVDLTNNATISIDSVLLGIALDGVKWRYNRLDGWGMGAGVETNTPPRPSQHGNFAGPTYRRSRVITIAGDVVAQTRAAAVAARDTLAGLLPDGSVGTFAVSDPDLGVRSAQVTLSDTPLSDDSSIGVGIFHWSLQFTAPDWRKYGEPQSGDTGLPGGGTGLAYNLAYPLDYGDPGEPGRVSFTNTGNAATEPSFTITPPLSVGFEITRVETGQRLRYEHPVGSELVLDCSAGTVMEAGQRRERYLTVREWPSVGPGETATFQFSTLGAETYLDPAHLSGQMAPAYP
jgi:hypothetical protein